MSIFRTPAVFRLFFAAERCYSYKPARLVYLVDTSGHSALQQMRVKLAEEGE